MPFPALKSLAWCFCVWLGLLGAKLRERPGLIWFNRVLVGFLVFFSGDFLFWALLRGLLDPFGA